MKEFFENNKGRKSMMRLIAFGCYVTGSFVAIAGVFTKDATAIMAGVGLAVVGIAGKYGQKITEGKNE